MAPDGVYALEVPEEITAVGTAVYIVAADNSLTTTATSNTLFGHTTPVIDKGVATGATNKTTATTTRVRWPRPERPPCGLTSRSTARRSWSSPPRRAGRPGRGRP